MNSASALRVGVVGTGWVAHQHAHGYQLVSPGDITLEAACDPDTSSLNSFSDKWGVHRRYSDVQDLISDGDIDALLLLTPPSVREEVITPAIGRGLHLLVEKPFATTGSEAVRYTEAAEQAGVTMAVSQNFRWFPEYQWLKRRMAGDDAGSTQAIQALSYQDRLQGVGAWRAREQKLEMAIYSIHLIDRIQWLSGSTPRSVAALTRPGPDPLVPGEQFSSLTVDFEDGTVGQMTSSWLSRGLPHQGMRIDTTTGSALVRRTHPMHGAATGQVQFGASTSDVAFQERKSEPHGTLSYGFSGQEFARAVRDRDEPSHSARNNLSTMGIMEAAYISAARGGEKVTVEEALAT